MNSATFASGVQVLAAMSVVLLMGTVSAWAADPPKPIPSEKKVEQL